jgi:putative transposase
MRNHKLPIFRQSELLGISRGTFYYKEAPESQEDILLMNRIDMLHTENSAMGSRMLRDTLKLEGISVGRKHVATLMKKMGIEAIYRHKRTSIPGKNNKIYPYLLKGLVIDKPNMVWATDITYIPMKKGFVYLCAIVDWASRKVLSHRVSITMDVDFCIEALQEALDNFGVPQYFNTDQGSQFTSVEFVNILLKHGIKVSMDGKGRWVDNVIVERLWRSLKYEEVYLYAYETVSQAKEQIKKYLAYYNSRRPHSSLGGKTPNDYYLKNIARQSVAA